jgi:DNA-binding Lrp family transcriptional regulator
MKNTSIKQEQFTIIPHSLMSSKNLTDQDKTTLAIIISFVDNNKECYIGNDRLGDMLGISKNAASKRILRLESLGCIQLNYTYKKGKKEVDKRYITFVNIEPQVSPDKIGGISSQTIPYSPTDDTLSPDRREEVSPKVGGIIQPSLLNNLKNNLPNKELNKEIELTEDDKEQLLELIKNIITPDDKLIGLVETLIIDGADFLTNANKELIRKNKHYFNKGTLLPKFLEQKLN